MMFKKIAFRTVQRSAWGVFASGKGQLLVVKSVQPRDCRYRLDGQVGRLQAAYDALPSNRPTSSNLTAPARAPARICAHDVMLNTAKGYKTLLTG
jgi:hypothetical protein